MALILRPLEPLWQVTLALCCLVPAVRGQAPQPPLAAPTAAEHRVSIAMDQARKQGPLALHAFLHAMPKGGDLHNHLSGAVYAETWLRDAAEDNLCVDPANMAFTKPLAVPSGGSPHPPQCNPGSVPASDAPNDQHLYDELVDAFSMRTFVPTSGDSGHDHFFNAFAHFAGVSKSHTPEWLDEVASRAARQNGQYLELMWTPESPAAKAIEAAVPFNPDFAAYRRALLDHGLARELPGMRAQLDTYERALRQRDHCDSVNAAPACQVTLRFIFQVLRNHPPESVFGQMLLGFELASADPRFVALNLVQPEDDYYSMRDYTLHMRMLAALRPFYPRVKLSLHAGELAPGLVRPSGLTFHIEQAVDIAHADRIGHGVDVMYEDDPYTLMERMAARHIAVEINLTSNDVILNLKGSDHPFPEYLQYGVPVALSTDDEGVSRIDLTHEYVRAAETYRLNYLDLKRIARNSLEYSFLPGASLWQNQDYAKPVAVCRPDLLKARETAPCERYLGENEKAREQRELERRFASFEVAAGGALHPRSTMKPPKKRLVH
jgi:adenosine deaminase